MDKVLYVELVEDKFDDWCGNCEYLVSILKDFYVPLKLFLR